MEPRKRHVRHLVTEGGRDLFAEWVDDQKDVQGRAVIRKRIDRMYEGNFGDHSYVGLGVWELRIHYGPGYRVYYGEDGPVLVLFLCGGDKSSQKKDIRIAMKLWTEYKESK